MGMKPVFRWHHLIELHLHLERRLARCHAGPVAHAEDVGVDGNRRLTEGDVEYDVRGLAADAGQRLQRLARARACSSTSFFDKATTFFALVRKRPMVFTSSRTRSSPNAAIFCGVSAAANSAGVALLTPASVACAESTTATSKVNGLTCLSSPLGSGMAAWKRRNASAIAAGVHCGIAPAAAFLSAATRLRGPLSCASLPRAARTLLCAVLRSTFRATLRATLRGVLRAIVPV
jgi:hypothetical protein